MLSATLKKAEFGDVDQDKVARFRAQHLKSIKRKRDKGHRDFKGMTDAQCEEAADTLLRLALGSMSGKLMFRKVTWVNA